MASPQSMEDEFTSTRRFEVKLCLTGLLNHVKKSLQVHHSPYLFHVSYEIGKGTSSNDLVEKDINPNPTIQLGGNLEVISMPMSLSKRLDEIKQRVSSLAREIKDLHDDLQVSEQSQAGVSKEEKDLRPISESIMSFLAFSPRMEEDAILDMILQCAMYVVRAGGAGLTLFDHKKNKLVFKAAIGDGSGGIIGYEVPLEGSQHGLAFATGEVQSATPQHTEIESATKSEFRNVLVAPLLVDGEGVGTMSAVNKQDADHFTTRDMEAYKLFADLAALVVRQRVREQILERLMKGDYEKAHDDLKELPVSEDDALLLDIVQDIAKLAQGREDLLPLLQKLVGLLLEISNRIDWRR